VIAGTPPRGLGATSSMDDTQGLRPAMRYRVDVRARRVEPDLGPWG
jgi:hypothetical protein